MRGVPGMLRAVAALLATGARTRGMAGGRTSDDLASESVAEGISGEGGHHQTRGHVAGVASSVRRGHVRHPGAERTPPRGASSPHGRTYARSVASVLEPGPSSCSAWAIVMIPQATAPNPAPTHTAAPMGIRYQSQDMGISASPVPSGRGDFGCGDGSRGRRALLRDCGTAYYGVRLGYPDPEAGGIHWGSHPETAVSGQGERTP